jgi:hypothetical protein
MNKLNGMGFQPILGNNMIKIFDNGLYDTEIVYSSNGLSPCLRANGGYFWKFGINY